MRTTLAEADLSDPQLRGLVDEQLLRALLRVGLDDRADRERARGLATALRTDRPDDATRRRRLALVEPLIGAR